MISEVKSMMSSDIYDLMSYTPDDKKSFMFLIRVMVGANDEKGEESFDIEICTPKWLMDNHNLAEIVLGKHKLIVFEFDMRRILEKVKKLFDNCSGKDWNEIAIKLSRIGHWEFEDYRE